MKEAELTLATTLRELAGRNVVLLGPEDAALLPVRTDAGAGRLVRTLSVRAAGKGGAQRAEEWSDPQQTLRDWASGHHLTVGSAAHVASVQWWEDQMPTVRVGAGTLPVADYLARAPRPRQGIPPQPDRPVRAGPDAAAAWADGRAKVDEVKQTYGRLRGDIGYRIEYSALFDPAVPLTAQFETALVQWDDVDESTPAAEITRRAGLVRITFDTARAHAETVGIAPLPDGARTDARRAAKAARLAKSTTSEAERTAALARVVAILRDLALVHLPDPDAVDRTIER